MEKNLTTGSVSKTIVYFALPYLLSYFLQTLYGMADLFITGQFCGIDSITAVSNGSQVMHMLTVIIVGLAMGTTVVIGRAIGADNKENAGVAIGNTITLFMGLSIVLTVVLLALVKPIVSLIAIPEEAVSGTVAYLIICFIGIPFITAYNIISSIFRGMGDSKSPMYFIAVACAANIALDYLFIGACSLGPIGAALGQSALMGPIAVAAYSYMSLVPIIQPPIMKLCTTEKERKIKMDQLRPVSKLEKILFPIVITIVVCLILPTTAPLVGMLMLGNLFRECGVVKQLTETASNALMYIVVILLGTSVGASTSAEAFLNADTLKIVVLGLVAFAIGTFGGCMLGKLLCKLTHGKINPLIGSAGVSAVPMAARVSQKVGAEADPTNFLLMHAMGPNVAGVIGTAVAAGTFMAIFGV